jgi:hypothetical protein
LTTKRLKSMRDWRRETVSTFSGEDPAASARFHVRCSCAAPLSSRPLGGELSLAMGITAPKLNFERVKEE